MTHAVGQTHGFEGFLHPSAPFVPGHPVQPEPVLDVLVRGEDRHEVEGLKDEAELVASDGRALGFGASRRARC